MWLDLLRGWLGVRADEPPAETRDRLHHETEALWGDSVAEHYAYLATLLSLPLEEESAERIKSLDAEGLRQRFFFTLRGWVQAMSDRGPLVLAFSDVHWADTTSLDLLRHCLPLCDHQELLWLTVFRADRTSPVWEFRHQVETEYPHRVTSLSLPPLTEGQSSEMIDQLIGARTLPAETRALILDKAQGNPYYVAELVHSLIAQGVLARDTNGWRATRAIASLDLPDSLQGLLLARIDSLSAGERRVLQMAAVIGSVFWFKVLEGLAADVPDLRHHLTALQRAELIYERGRVPDLGMEYVFKSSLMRDAACEGTLSAQRVSRHRQVAEQLEQLLGAETLTQYAGALAYHYHRAQESKKELFYTLQAADHARGIYANAEALQHYTGALELLDQIEAQAASEDQLYAIRTQRFEVLDRRCEVFYMRGDFEAGRADAQALLPLARQLEDDPSWLIDALLQQPSVAHWRSREELEAGVPMAQQALALARQLGDRRREMQSLVAIASLGLYLNNPDVWELAEQALELARHLGDQRFELGLLIGMGQVYAWSDQPERGMKHVEAALPLSQALGDKMSEMALLDLIGMQYERSGDYYRLLTEYTQKRLTISREIGHRPMEGNTLTHCGQIQSLRLGDYEAGLAGLEECLRIWEGFPGELNSLLRVAQIKSVQGRYDEALDTLEHAHRITGVQYVHPMGSAGMRLVSAILYNGLGDRAHLHQALELASETRQLVADNPLLFRQYEMAAACESTAAHLALAEFPTDQVERQTHLSQALESSQAALDLYQSFGYVQIVECVSEEILYRHSLALAANGRQAEAGEFLQRAHDEMMRKHDLIPADSPFRRTYLEEIPLHRDIRTALTASTC
jgi:tetratricopeptide (TPR) repeat protein